MKILGQVVSLVVLSLTLNMAAYAKSSTSPLSLGGRSSLSSRPVLLSPLRFHFLV